jgi:uncharacterized protein YceH (UPF0502 family)
MLLRGAQTPGEIRTRTNRLATFNDVKEVENALELLAGEERGPLVVKLPREAGKRESRYMHLFCGEVDMSELAVASSAPSSAGAERVVQLEQEVVQLREELEALKEQVASLLS